MVCQKPGKPYATTSGEAAHNRGGGIANWAGQCKPTEKRPIISAAPRPSWLVGWRDMWTAQQQEDRFAKCTADELIRIAETGKDLDGRELTTGAPILAARRLAVHVRRRAQTELFNNHHYAEGIYWWTVARGALASPMAAASRDDVKSSRGGSAVGQPAEWPLYSFASKLRSDPPRDQSPSVSHAPSLHRSRDGAFV